MRARISVYWVDIYICMLSYRNLHDRNFRKILLQFNLENLFNVMKVDKLEN